MLKVHLVSRMGESLGERVFPSSTPIAEIRRTGDEYDFWIEIVGVTPDVSEAEPLAA